MSESKPKPTGRVIGASVASKAGAAAFSTTGGRLVPGPKRGGALVEDTSVIGNLDGSISPRPPQGLQEGATDPRERTED